MNSNYFEEEEASDYEIKSITFTAAGFVALIVSVIVMVAILC